MAFKALDKILTYIERNKFDQRVLSSLSANSFLYTVANVRHKTPLCSRIYICEYEVLLVLAEYP